MVELDVNMLEVEIEAEVEWKVLERVSRC